MNALVKSRPRSAKQFRDGWMSFLRVLARDSKIKFSVGRPATDGNTIYLPALPAELTKDDEMLFKAFGYHEVGHVLHSNMQLYPTFGKEHGKQAHSLLNAIDDVWMEETQARFSKAAGRYFREKVTILTSKKMFRDGSASPFEAIASYCLTALGALKRPEFEQPKAIVRENVRLHFGEDADQLLENLDEILFSEFPNVRSTDDAGRLALRIIEMLKQQSQQQDEVPEDEPEDEQDPGEEADPAEDGQSGDEQGDGEQTGESDSTENDQSDESGDADNADAGNEGEEGESDSTDQDGDQDSQAGNGDGTDESSDSDGCEEGDEGNGKPTLAEIIKQMFEEDIEEGEVFDARKYIECLAEEVENGEAPDYQGQTPVPAFNVDGESVSQQSTLGAGKGELIEGMPVCPADREIAKEIEGNLDRKFQVLAMKLQCLLMNREEADVYTTTRGRIGESHLYRFGMGNTRIFEQQEEIERVSAAVSLVADLSGSTLYVPGSENLPAPRSEEERKAFEEQLLRKSAFSHIQHSLLIMEKMLDQLGNPREILGFAPKSGELSTIVRSFGDDHQTAATRIGGLRHVVGGGHTPIGEAVFQATNRLMAHEAQRKVMFVLTDGAPSDVELAKYQTEVALKAGISVVYLLIGEQVVTDWLDEMECPYVHAKSAEELCPILLDQAEALLM
jgi:cobalamin biosynthesis protein CobT